MSTMGRRHAYIEAARLGVTILEYHHGHGCGRLSADAPPGSRFEPDLHSLVADYGYDFGPKAEAWQDLAKRLQGYAVLECCHCEFAGCDERC